MHAFWLKRSKINPVQHLQTPSVHEHGLPDDGDDVEDDINGEDVEEVEFCFGLGFGLDIRLA